MFFQPESNVIVFFALLRTSEMSRRKNEKIPGHFRTIAHILCIFPGHFSGQLKKTLISGQFQDISIYFHFPGHFRTFQDEWPPCKKRESQRKPSILNWNDLVYKYILRSLK